MNRVTFTPIAGVLITSLFWGVPVMAGSHSEGQKGGYKERFQQMDQDKDGTVTHAEMMQEVRKKFNGFDKNKDGFLELGELPRQMPLPDHAPKRMAKHKEKMKHSGTEAEGGGVENGKMKPRRKPSRLKFVARLDRDGDERVSLNEFAQKATQRFKMGDINGDGSVTLAEIKEARKHHKKKRHEKKHRRDQ